MSLLQKHKVRPVIMLILMLFVLRNANAHTDRKLNRQIKMQIAELLQPELEPSLVRFHAGEKLIDLTYGVRSDLISKSTVEYLVSLLDTSDDLVRFYVAAALGNIRAKGAIPKMLEVLPTSDCVAGAITSADSIRAALEKMGVSPPPRPTYAECHGLK